MRSRAVAWPLAGALASALACSPATTVAPRPLLPSAEAAYLLDPTAGYPLTDEPALAARIAAGWRQLTASDTVGAEGAAAGVLAEAPGFAPARVLRAEAALARGDAATAVEAVRAVVDELPGYEAAALVLARAEERRGDPVAAVAAFLGVETASPLAARRAAELMPAAVTELSRRIDADLARGRLDLADAHLDRLVLWAAEAPATLEARQRVAAQAGDRVEELSVLRTRVGRGAEDRALLERLAELEVEAGDVAAGIDRFETLVSRYPDEPALREALEGAKLRWQLQLLPPAVQEIARRPTVDRGGLAALVYWLVPDVRYGALRNPPIATDILDHPQREEILRVIDRGLVSVDVAVHQYHPGRTATRGTALRAFLRLLAGTEPPAACVEGVAPGVLGDGVAVCRPAVRCRLLADEAECLSEAPTSGAEVVEMASRALEALGAR